ncbi:hypothetical protein [Alteriqipengyuania lutimaris]|uniref:Uncharacterized protein n=1 Tax=Alteriqipengyuania lutimaris TaxID=1538146 RepID=A0A395LNL2_9SPHN|nr:hypothetical protein [Alteriqipengyuania lutimaris]MBB3034960.1 hypothetical protein [Alteriqipengyuania lutimaris]RDS76220.1 hypothetical protein DL238_00365 [Alteriqipengyuania lutimaris]
MSSTTLTQREEILAWAKEHNATPCVVADTMDDDGGLGLIRVSIGQVDEGLKAVDWNDWLEEFENKNLALIVSEETGNDFNKLVGRS